MRNLPKPLKRLLLLLALAWLPGSATAEEPAAAKAIQNRLFEAWRQQGAAPFPNPPDLKTDVRPAISALTGRIIAALANLDGINAAALCAALAPVPAVLGADADAWRIAAAPLRERKGGC